MVLNYSWDFSQMAVGSEDEDRERLPELPPIPELPEAPELRPQLPPIPKPPGEEEPNQYQQMGIAYIIPIALITPILALTLLGVWLDGKFNRSPMFTVGGALLGTIVGFMNMFRMAGKLNR